MSGSFALFPRPLPGRDLFKIHIRADITHGQPDILRVGANFPACPAFPVYPLRPAVLPRPASGCGRLGNGAEDGGLGALDCVLRDGHVQVVKQIYCLGVRVKPWTSGDDAAGFVGKVHSASFSAS